MLVQRFLAPPWISHSQKGISMTEGPSGPDWVPPLLPSVPSASSVAHSLSASRAPSRWHFAPTPASIPLTLHSPPGHCQSQRERGSGSVPHAGVPCSALGQGRTGTSTSPQEGGVRYRPARKDDLALIQRMVLSEWMNPLSLDWRRFLVAEEVEPGEAGQPQLIGIGQVKPWGASNVNGEILELRSVIVSQEYRGKGVGSSIVGKLLERAKEQGEDHPVFLLTIGKRVPFYERWGFKEVTENEEVPRQLQGELALGKVAARLTVGDRCLCMKLGAR